MKVAGEEEKSTESVQFKPESSIKLNKSPSNGKAYTYEKIRKKHKAAYKRWTDKLDDELTVMYSDGVNVPDLAKHFGRTKGAIRARIKKFELTG
jgi:hypothetical protein